MDAVFAPRRSPSAPPRASPGGQVLGAEALVDGPAEPASAGELVADPLEVPTGPRPAVVKRPLRLIDEIAAESGLGRHRQQRRLHQESAGKGMHVQQRHRLGPSGAPDGQSSPMDALTLKELYESQLREELKCPPTPDFNRREISCMLRVSRGMTPGALYGHDHARTWVWSDLHLGHTKTIKVFQRPFGTADEMNDTIFRNWEQVVAPADTILILGDVTVHGLWGRRLARVRQAPGRKILVYGNHEITGTGSVETDGFDEVHSSLHVDGDPPLLLTHVPLRVVPGGCVNIHGHLHHKRIPGRTRHINVCVEQLQYRPRALSTLHRLARRLVNGKTVRGRTTTDQLGWVG